MTARRLMSSMFFIGFNPFTVVWRVLQRTGIT
jgi:hypothetical protein